MFELVCALATKKSGFWQLIKIDLFQVERSREKDILMGGIAGLIGGVSGIWGCQRSCI